MFRLRKPPAARTSEVAARSGTGARSGGGLWSRGNVVSNIAHATCIEEPPLMPAGPWWEALDPEFNLQAEGFDLALLDRLRVESTSALDVLVRTGASLGLSALAAPLGFSPAELRLSRDDGPFYHRFVEGSDPQRFFVPPGALPPFRVRPTSDTTFRPSDGVCESIRFESSFVPQLPRLRAPYLSHETNRFAHIRYWRHNRGPRPTVIAIHGFGAEGYALNQWFFALPWLYDKLGLDVALFNLPFHGRRQTRFSPFSGHGFFAGGLSRINEAFAQAVHDFRLVMDYLERHRGVEAIGVTGISLGGFTTALLAATEPRLRFAIPNVPVVSLADIVLDWEPLGTLVRLFMRATGLSITEARRLLAVSSPLTWPSVLPRSRLLVIGGVGDKLAPPTHARLLWDHWGRPRLHWFPGGHLLHLDRGGYLREIQRFFKDIDFGT